MTDRYVVDGEFAQWFATESEAQAAAFAWACRLKRPVTVRDRQSGESWDVHPE
jgi:hypothetical protein